MIKKESLDTFKKLEKDSLSKKNKLLIASALAAILSTSPEYANAKTLEQYLVEGTNDNFVSYNNHVIKSKKKLEKDLKLASSNTYPAFINVYGV
jgi:hypothetical protein